MSRIREERSNRSNKTWEDSRHVICVRRSSLKCGEICVAVNRSLSLSRNSSRRFAMDTLRDAKKAMDEGLIDQKDFEEIKKAWLKAQQIKAGIDAGFLREEDYLQARDSFLQSLDFQVASSNSLVGSTPASGNSPVKAGGGGSGAFGGNPTRLSAASLPQVAARPPPPPMMPPPPPILPQPAANGASSLSHAAPAAVPSGSGSKGASSSAGLAALVDLPRIGKAGVAEGKKSMSGISVHDQCINAFFHMKTKSSFKWISYKIDDAGHEVIPEAVGPSDSSYNDFVASLPPNNCRFGVFDYAYTNADTHQTIKKLVFVSWAPECATTRTKMMYASTKEFFKGFLDGVGAELQASEPHELEEGEMKERVHQALTRK